MRCALVALLLNLSPSLVFSQAEDACLTRRIFVYLRDSKDRTALVHLEAKNFSGQVNRRPVEIRVAEPWVQPRRVAILLDVSGSMKEVTEAVIVAARSFAGQLNSSTSCEVVIFDQQIEARTECSADRAALLADARNVKPKHGRTAIYDVISEVINHWGDASSNDVIFLISDGGDNASKIKIEEISRLVIKTGVRMPALLVEDSRIASQEEDEGKANVGALCNESGADFLVIDKAEFKSNLKGIVYDTPVLTNAVINSYRLTIHLPEPLHQAKSWALKLENIPPELKNRKYKLFYPQKLAACNP